MKKYCLLLLLAMFSCQKSQLGGDQSSSFDSFITYTSRVEAASKAAPTKLDGLKNDGFAVTSIVNDGSERELYYSDVVNFMDGVWRSPFNRYWPVNGSLDFFAYSPMGRDFVEINQSIDPYVYTMTYNCPQNIDNQIDMLVVTKKDCTAPKKTVAPVDMAFDHALSSIAFEVEFEGETNITLGQIIINYIHIEKERTYDFITEKWIEPAEKIYFDLNDGLSTYLNVYEQQKVPSGNVVFDNIDNHLMIIPQPINHSRDAMAHYISVQVAYTLNSEQDGGEIPISTGVMPLPAPTSENFYEQGHVYTYRLKINGETINFGGVNIEDQEKPQPAFGNIDLALIPVTSLGQNYNETAKRVEELLRDGVRDFVVVGSMGANDDPDHTLGDGKLGYYGAETSPFNMGAIAVGGSKDAFEFSVDLRGTYGYPKFKNANENGTAERSEDIDPDDDTFNAGLFKDVDGLIEVMLPNGIMAIGDHAFENCDKLTSIDIAQVKHIEVGTFQFSKALETVYNGNLTRVHNNAFKDCISLRTIDLSGVGRIGASAFTECAELTNVNLSSLDSIGDYAFHGCSNLTLEKGTEFKDGCFKTVSDFSFYGCYRLGENGALIDLTDTKRVGDHAFQDCQHIRLSSGELRSLTTVENYAFSGCYLLGQSHDESGNILYHDFNIPLLNSIGESAFKNCQYVNITDGLQNLKLIPKYAFENCVSLTGYAADSENKVLSLPFVTEVMDNGLLNTAVTSVAFSGELTKIGDNAFGSCEALSTVTGTRKVQSVGNSAFAGTALTEIEFSETLTEVGKYAFDGCAELENVTGHEKIVKTGIKAFSNCPKLKRLVLPELTQANCGGGLFLNSYGLEELSLPLITNNMVSWVDDYDGKQNTTIFAMIGAAFTNLRYLNLKSLMSIIPGWHFQNRESLEEVNFASILSIGGGAFYGCSSLRKADFSSAMSVGAQAFQKCAALEKLNLSGITSANDIVASAFWDIPNNSCDIWLSESQAALAKADGNWWQGIQWRNVYAPSDNVKF